MVAGVRFSSVAFSAVLLATACNDVDVVAPTKTAAPAFAVYVPPPGEGGVVCTGYLKARAFGGPAGYIDYGHLCETALDIISPPLQAVYEDGHTGPYDLTVEFSRPVAHLVVMPVDIWHCGADPGSITAYAPSGASVTLPFTADASDCGVKHEEHNVYYFGSGTLPQSLVITSLDSVTRVVIRPTSDMSWFSSVFYPDRVVTSEGFVGTVYLLSFREPVTAASVVIFKAQGPNAGGSFTTRSGENKLSLAAGVTPATLAPTIQWEVVDDPDDAVLTFEPNGVTPAFGPTVDASVPPQDAGRWAAIPHRGKLNQKSLALRVTAAVDGSGTLIRSTPAVVRQDEIDTVREEYIELGLAPPGRGQFTGEPPVEVGLNTGDYGVMVWSNAFTTVLNALRFAWTARWQINSQYRNPVHQKWHVGSETNSAHQYSCAADLQTFPPRVDDPVTHERHFRTVQDSLTASQYWTALADLADRQGFIVEPLKASNIGHVHVEKKAC